MFNSGEKKFWPTSGQARKAARKGRPELSIECPQCHSAVGRTCFMKPGIMGVTHTVRKIRYQQLRAAENAALIP
jgi:hypothetical protein